MKSVKYKISEELTIVPFIIIISIIIIIIIIFNLLNIEFTLNYRNID